MALPFNYSKKLLLQRIRKHVSDQMQASDSFSTSDNEILLYIDQAVASTLVGQVYGMAKLEGNLAMPEAYLSTYSIPLTKDSITGYWNGTLPQTPVSLPLGYSITRVYFAASPYGVSKEIYLIRAKRVGRRTTMPLPPGGRAWVENDNITVGMTDGGSLLGLNLYVQMAKTRTDSLSETMALPDDAIEAIFTNVTTKILSRYNVPQDIVKDNLAAGNKSS